MPEFETDYLKIFSVAPKQKQASNNAAIQLNKLDFALKNSDRLETTQKSIFSSTYQKITVNNPLIEMTVPNAYVDRSKMIYRWVEEQTLFTIKSQKRNLDRETEEVSIFDKKV